MPQSTPLPTPIARDNPDSRKFQLSTWIDANLVSEPGAGTRGYWENIRVTPDLRTRPTLMEITNAKNVLRKTYHINQIYLIITRQYNIEDLKKLVLDWKHARVAGVSEPALIPTLVLQNYKDNGCNFTNDELTGFVRFLKENINSQAIAVMDVYDISKDPKRNQCNQLALIKETHGGELHGLGLQPSEPLKAPFTMAVSDVYWYVSRGNTNENWSTRCGWNVNKEVPAKDQLQEKVKNRVNQGENIAWDLVAVAMDYTKEPPCGADTAGDLPLASGRNMLVHDLIVAQYPNGGDNSLWRGFSFDFKVLDDYAKYHDPKDRRPYTMLRSGAPYAGYFSAPLNEIAAIYDLYD